ncbi:MAG: hypothetical protein QOI96_589 [Verrucomicrobiota bacterium]
MKKIVVLFSVIVTAAAFVIAAEPKEGKETSKATATAEHKIFAPSDLKWADAPPGLPPGAKMAVLDGDPTKKGPFTVRLQAPAGYKIPPHTHPTAERLTVISGTVDLGMGDKLDEGATRPLATGSFAVLPTGMKHFVWNKGESIVQIHSEGPFEIKYVNPADDPRNAKK